MVFTVVLFAYRKPGMSPDAFRDHYETVHIPLMKELGGSLFPLSHTRQYISRTCAESPDAEQPYPPVLVSGSPSDFAYDAITEMVFESRDDFLKFSAVLASPEAAPKVEQDCGAFLDMSRAPSMVVMEPKFETRRD